MDPITFLIWLAIISLIVFDVLLLIVGFFAIVFLYYLVQTKKDNSVEAMSQTHLARKDLMD